MNNESMDNESMNEWWSGVEWMDGVDGRVNQDVG